MTLRNHSSLFQKITSPIVLIPAIYTSMRGLYELRENKGKKKNVGGAVKQISLALAYHLQGKGSIVLICYRRIGNS